MEVAQAFNGLIMLVRDVSLHYHARVHGMLSNEVSLDFNGLFGRQIQAFHSTKGRIIAAMWKHQLGDHESLDVMSLRAWLKPRDRVLKKICEDNNLTPARRDEYTCEWFQRHLLDFSRSHEDLLCISGPEGCGKTHLSRWIIERLQRPLGKKSRTYNVLLSERDY